MNEHERAVKATKKSISISDVIDELLKIKIDCLAEMEQKIVEAVVTGYTAEPGWQGFTGLAGFFDERVTTWPRLEEPKQFTPAEFNKLWNSFSKERKVEYVISLIT